MKAVILAAGKGTRMRELTAELPKPMLKVHGKPILEHIIAGIMEAGIRDFCIITGFKAAMAHFVANRRQTTTSRSFVERPGRDSMRGFPEQRLISRLAPPKAVEPDRTTI